jgi:crotonobetainyl-CoA:carnitine CoA-transferase CaiB-like acyl-CoA transferase
MVEHDQRRQPPLTGIRVLELATFFAGPLCGSLLAEFGAEVIKAEQPGVGDPWRRSGPRYGDTSMSFLTDNRNKRGITLNLSTPQGQELVRRLAKVCDVVIENFRGGGLERWGIGYQHLKAINPGLIMVRISGFGQEGAYTSRPAFGTILESMTGLAHNNGDADGTPRQMPLAMGDLVTGTHAAYGVLLALRHRDRTGEGQEIDSAICDALFRWTGPEALHYRLRGDVPRRQGGALYNARTPTTGFFQTQDGGWLFIRCHHSDAAVARLYCAMGRPELAEAPHYSTTSARQAHAAEVRGTIEAWMQSVSRDEALARLQAQGVAAGPVYSAMETFDDPHFQARGVFEEVPHPTLGLVPTPAVTPRLTLTPGRVEHLGLELGAHNEEVYCGLLQLTPDELAALQSAGVI